MSKITRDGTLDETALLLFLGHLLNVLLVSTYELGRQPFGLASPAAWLRNAGFDVKCLDLSRDSLDEAAVRRARFIAFYVPMHTATRLAIAALPDVLRVNPRAHICFYGLYAPMNEPYLRKLGAHTILGGEFEEELVRAATRVTGASVPSRAPLADPVRRGGSETLILSRDREGAVAKKCSVTARLKPCPDSLPTNDAQLSIVSTDGRRDGGATRQPELQLSLPRLKFQVPDRSDLPDLSRYAHLENRGSQSRLTGYTEASRGCKHLCRHCPITPVYQGHFRIVQRDVVIEDIRRQVAAGAQHITFGDPDFFNGIRHAIAIVTELHTLFPQLTYDLTIKVEHLLKHAELIPTLRGAGCLFVTTAVESFEDRVLSRLEKGHTYQDFLRVVGLFRKAGLALAPTFVAFTPWTTLENYCQFLETIAKLDLVQNVAPVQLCVRLLIPAGSRLLELEEIRDIVDPFSEAQLMHPWQHPDPRMDELHERLQAIVLNGLREKQTRSVIFARVWRAAQNMVGSHSEAPWPDMPPLISRAAIPYLTEPWYC